MSDKELVSWWPHVACAFVSLNYKITCILLPPFNIWSAGRLQQWEAKHSFTAEAGQLCVHAVSQSLVPCIVSSSRSVAPCTCYHWAASCANPRLHSYYHSKFVRDLCWADVGGGGCDLCHVPVSSRQGAGPTNFGLSNNCLKNFCLEV